jgi:hypothetical protein
VACTLVAGTPRGTCPPGGCQLHGLVAPTVEQLLCKQTVVGSNPTWSTKRILEPGDNPGRGSAPLERRCW